MDRDGRLVARGVVGRSGSATLDAAALELLERAAPLPKPPPQIVGGEVVLRLPLQYRMKD
jgi:protein TonB